MRGVGCSGSKCVIGMADWPKLSPAQSINQSTSSGASTFSDVHMFILPMDGQCIVSFSHS